MGGCASKPKDLTSGPEPLPSENPASPKQPEGETVPQENNGGETKEEAPLVDISEPAKEAPKSEDTTSAEAKPAEAEAVSVKPTKENVEAAKETKEEPAKEEEKKEVEEEPKVEVVAPSSEVKNDAPLVTV